MPNFMNEQLKELNEWLASNPKITPSLKKSLSLYELFKASECLLIEAYEHTAFGIKRQCDTIEGDVDLGAILHWLNYPEKGWENIVEYIVKVLEKIENAPLPPSKISPQLYSKIIQEEISGIVLQDGTIYGEQTYEKLDKQWHEVIVSYLYYQCFPDKVHPFSSKPQSVQLANPNGSTRIAIVGDWGAGRYRTNKGNDGPAVAVMKAIESLQPDYLIHLGDIYYVGTDHYETTNFIDLWPQDRFGGGEYENTSFTLNSNHEMCGGGNGYFNVALNSAETPFTLQKGTSYFALHVKPWLILGLDSAYYARAKPMFKQGSLGPSNSGQMEWIKDNFSNLKDTKVIVLTHHNAITYDGTKHEPIWKELKQALNNRPDYWYWGHVHNGIVYSSSLPKAEGAKVRCVGHGAIPYGKAWGLAEASGIDYYGQTPESPNSVRVRNGFALLTLNSDGTMEEVFYEVEDGTDKPIIVWKGKG